MLCEVCKKNAATVHVTDITRFECGDEAAPFEFEQRHLCEPCAGLLDLPSQPLVAKADLNVWKLLQQAQVLRMQDVECTGCGMTLRGFRQGGKLGCPACYEAFGQQLGPLLLRMHNASQHVGRVPGGERTAPDEHTRGRDRHLRELHRRLESAVLEEDYEHAARLRDAIQALEEAPTAGETGEGSEL